MAELVWDAAGTRKYETGVSHGVLYVQTPAGNYLKGVAWNGLTGVTESPDGAEPNDLWADNIKYATLRSAETFGATIEAYTYPEEFMACDGTAKVHDGVYIGQQGRTPFGFCYRTEIGSDTMAADTDAGYKLHIVYNATASPSERSYETINDSPDAITFSWEVTTTAVPVTGYKPISTITIDSTKANADDLAALEGLLYGDGDVVHPDSPVHQPTLPPPDIVLRIMSGNHTVNVAYERLDDTVYSEESETFVFVPGSFGIIVT